MYLKKGTLNTSVILFLSNSAFAYFYYIRKNFQNSFFKKHTLHKQAIPDDSL